MALASVALASCVKNEISAPELEGVKIGFAAPVMYSSVDTRANVYGEIGTTGTTSAYPEDESFMIFAVQHEGALTSWDDATEAEFNGQEISHDSNLGAWVPKNSVTGSYYYWPTGKLMSFAAVSPADLEVDGCNPKYDANGLMLENFVINDDPANQYDLLFSKRATDKSADDMIQSSSYYSGISIEFKHALTSIHFAISKEEGVTDDIALTKIELVNAVNKGSFNENITDETEYASKPTWEVSNDAEDIQNYVAFSGKVVFPTEQKLVSVIAANDADSDDENEKSHALLLLPQALTDNIDLEVSYTVKSNGTSSEFKKIVNLNAYPAGNPITKWEIGKRYTYRLIYGKASQKQDVISFSPSVEGWVDATTIDIVL